MFNSCLPLSAYILSNTAPNFSLLNRLNGWLELASACDIFHLTGLFSLVVHYLYSSISHLSARTLDLANAVWPVGLAVRNGTDTPAVCENDESCGRNGVGVGDLRDLGLTGE